MVGIFPDETSIVHLIGAVLLEANDKRATQTRYIQVEAKAELLSPPLTEGEATLANAAEITPRAT